MVFKDSAIAFGSLSTRSSNSVCTHTSSSNAPWFIPRLRERFRLTLSIFGGVQLLYLGALSHRQGWIYSSAHVFNCFAFPQSSTILKAAVMRPSLCSVTINCKSKGLQVALLQRPSSMPSNISRSPWICWCHLLRTEQQLLVETEKT